MNLKKIHILYLIDGLYPGGKERQFIEILKGLNREEFKIGIVTFNKNKFYTYQAKELSDYFIELDKTSNKFKPFVSIWKCFSQFKPDIIHTWDYLSSMYGYLPSRFHGVKFVNGSIRDSGTEKGWQNTTKKIMLQLADLTISNSLAGLRTYGISKGEVIYNAVDQNRFLEKENSEEFNLIKVANFTDYKDHLTFTMAAIELVNRKIVDHIFYAGDGKYKEKYRNLVNEKANPNFDKFVFLGAISNIEEYLKKCSVGVLCSTVKYSEGISNSVLEYMAASVVPVVTNIGGSSEIITDNVNGFLTRPESPKDIIAIVELIKSDKKLQERIIKEAKNTISEKFNYQGNLNKLIGLYRNLIN